MVETAREYINLNVITDEAIRNVDGILVAFDVPRAIFHKRHWDPGLSPANGQLPICCSKSNPPPDSFTK